MNGELPKGFEDLTPFMDWARSSEMSRNEKRWSATMEESRRFYDTMLKRAPDALKFLNGFSLAEIDLPKRAPERRLLDMCLALAEVSATIEMYEEPQPKYVFPIQRFIPTHDSWPLAGMGEGH
ncbi:MAG: hypothetical protein SV862_16205 [Pseudomonadota bacterium]|nr:hypothetical protein [Pseudomonadota bacterium]